MQEIIALNLRTAIFVIITLLWWAEFIIFPSQHEDQTTGKSFYYILGTILFSIGCSLTLRQLGIANLAEDRLLTAQTLGLAIYFFGLLVRYWSLILLGDYFTRGVSVETKQDLISVGPYKFLRHPLYLGLFLLTLGAVVFIANWAGIILAAIMMFLALRYRIILEEKQLEEIIGEQYRSWKSDRYRLFPFIY